MPWIVEGEGGVVALRVRKVGQFDMGVAMGKVCDFKQGEGVLLSGLDR